ncbi:MAG: stage VI sporulation protein F [bacterium]|nr:stage VI sporulation protein F [bacterium]
MKLTDNFFKKIEKKTNVDKETIINLAKNLQEDNLKNEDALRDVVKKLSVITGKEVSKEKEDKIINAILNDKVPDIDKMV